MTDEQILARQDKNKLWREQLEKDGDSAFAAATSGDDQDWQLGMTLRDYFAAKAMQSLMTLNENSNEDKISAWAYSQADAMLEARKRP